MAKQVFFKYSQTSSGLNQGNSITVNKYGVQAIGIVDGTNVLDFDKKSVQFVETGRHIFVTTLDTKGKQKFFKVAGKTNVSVNGDIECGYVTSAITGPTGSDFSGKVINTPGQNNDIIVSKLNECGKQKFFKIAGGNNSDVGNSISKNKQRVFVTGTILSNTVTDFKGNNNGNTGSAYVVGLTSCGKQLFFKRAGKNNFSFGGNKIITDKHGCYVTGGVGDNGYDFNGTKYIEPGGAFVARLDNNGKQKFFVKTMNFNQGVGNDIIKYKNYIYVTGFFGGFGINTNTDFNGNPVTYYGTNDIFFAKLDLNGNQIFFKTAGGINDDRGIRIGVNECGIYISGIINIGNPVDFNGNPVTLKSSRDGFIAKFNHDGTQQFFNTFGDISNTIVNDMKVIKKRIYITGNLNNNSPYIKAFNNNGEEKFSITLNLGEGRSLDVCGRDIYATGSLAGINATDFEGNPITTSATSLTYIAKIRDTTLKKPIQSQCTLYDHNRYLCKKCKKH